MQDKKHTKTQPRICSLMYQQFWSLIWHSVSLTDCIGKLYAIFFVWQHSFMCLLICVARRRIINNEKVGYTFCVKERNYLTVRLGMLLTFVKLCKSTKKQSIFNIIHWLAGAMGQMTHRPSIWCSKYYFLISAWKILYKNCFNLFFKFFYNITNMKIMNFECPKA